MSRLEEVLELERVERELGEQIISLMNEKERITTHKYVLQNACKHDFSSEFVKEVFVPGEFPYRHNSTKDVVYCRCVKCNAVRQKDSLPSIWG